MKKIGTFEELKEDEEEALTFRTAAVSLLDFLLVSGIACEERSLFRKKNQKHGH